MHCTFSILLTTSTPLLSLHSCIFHRMVSERYPYLGVNASVLSIEQHTPCSL